MTEFKDTKRGKFDYILLAAVLALVVIGLVFVYSASFYTAEKIRETSIFISSNSLSVVLSV